MCRRQAQLMNKNNKLWQSIENCDVAAAVHCCCCCSLLLLLLMRKQSLATGAAEAAAVEAGRRVDPSGLLSCLSPCKQILILIQCKINKFSKKPNNA